MIYEQYWSILETPSKSIKSYDVLLYVCLVSFILFILIKFFSKQLEKTEKKILLWSLGTFFIISSFSFFYLKIHDNDDGYKITKNALSSEKVNVVEGEIKNFKRINNINGRRGVTEESFTVNDVYFSYSSEVLAGFNSFNKTNNDIFRNGLNVKIIYGKENNDILEISIGK